MSSGYVRVQPDCNIVFNPIIWNADCVLNISLGNSVLLSDCASLCFSSFAAVHVSYCGIAANFGGV